MAVAVAVAGRCVAVAGADVAVGAAVVGEACATVGEGVPVPTVAVGVSDVGDVRVAVRSGVAVPTVPVAVRSVVGSGVAVSSPPAAAVAVGPGVSSPAGGESSPLCSKSAASTAPAATTPIAAAITQPFFEPPLARVAGAVAAAGGAWPILAPHASQYAMSASRGAPQFGQLTGRGAGADAPQASQNASRSAISFPHDVQRTRTSGRFPRPAPYSLPAVARITAVGPGSMFRMAPPLS